MVDASYARIFAHRFHSPFRSSAMDGYSCKTRGISQNPQQEFEVIGSSFAGKPFSGSMGIDQCVRIFTGAVVPDDADMVMLQAAR